MDKLGLMMVGTLIATLAVVFSASTSWAKVEFDSDQLKMKNADQITNMVKAKIQESSENSGQTRR